MKQYNSKNVVEFQNLAELPRCVENVSQELQLFTELFSHHQFSKKIYEILLDLFHLIFLGRSESELKAQVGLLLTALVYESPEFEERKAAEQANSLKELLNTEVRKRQALEKELETTKAQTLKSSSEIAAASANFRGTFKELLQHLAQARVFAERQGAVEEIVKSIERLREDRSVEQHLNGVESLVKAFSAKLEHLFGSTGQNKVSSDLDACIAEILRRELFGEEIDGEIIELDDKLDELTQSDKAEKEKAKFTDAKRDRSLPHKIAQLKEELARLNEKRGANLDCISTLRLRVSVLQESLDPSIFEEKLEIGLNDTVTEDTEIELVKPKKYIEPVEWTLEGKELCKIAEKYQIGPAMLVVATLYEVLPQVGNKFEGKVRSMAKVAATAFRVGILSAFGWKTHKHFLSCVMSEPQDVINRWLKYRGSGTKGLSLQSRNQEPLPWDIREVLRLDEVEKFRREILSGIFNKEGG